MLNDRAAAPELGCKRWKAREGAVASGSVTRAALASPQRSRHCLARLLREALGGPKTIKVGRVAMDRRGWQRLSEHLARHAALYIFVLAVAATVTIAARFPVYFRTDDVHYLRWAAAHPNPLSAFLPSENSLFGTFRPLNTLLWWVCYRLFGLNPIPYQLTITLAYGVSFVFFFRFVATIFSRRAAVFSLVAYLAIFSSLTSIVFWFSDMTFVLEVLLIHLSLYLLASAAVGRVTWLPWGVLCYLGASLTKEPAMLIVPVVASVFLATRWTTLPERSRRSVATVVLTILGFGIAWVIGTPSLRRRLAFSPSVGLPAVVDFLASRLRFYGRELLAGGGALVWIASLYLALTAWAERRRTVPQVWYYLFLAVALAAALLATWAPHWGLALLFLSFALIAAVRAPASAAAVWAVLPLIGILTVGMMTRAYLVEASFGLAALVGVAAVEFLERLVRDLQRLRPIFARATWVVLLALLCVAVSVEVPALRVRLHTLSVVSAVRQNFRDAVLFARDHLDSEGHHLIVVDYDELGIRYGRDLYGAGDIHRARSQKTMLGPEVQVLLRLFGAAHVEVRNLEWFRESAAGHVFFFAMNRSERDYILALGLELDLVYEVERGGEGAWVYRLVRGAADHAGPEVDSGGGRVSNALDRGWYGSG